MKLIKRHGKFIVGVLAVSTIFIGLIVEMANDFWVMFFGCFIIFAIATILTMIDLFILDPVAT